MNVSLPQLAIHAMPVKMLAGAASITGKFSAALAEAQDTTMPAGMGTGGSHVPKKQSGKSSDKNSAKTPAAHATATPTTLTPVTISTPHQVKSTPASILLTLEIIGAQKKISEASDSDGRAGGEFGLAIAAATFAHSPGKSAQSSGMASTHPANSAITPRAGAAQVNPADGDQPTATPTANLLGARTSRDEDTNAKTVVAPAIEFAAPVTSNTKPPASSKKPVSHDVARGATAESDRKIQTGVTISASATASKTPMTSVTLRGRQERTVQKAEAYKSEARKNDFDGTKDEAAHTNKGNASSDHGQAGNPGPANAPGAASSTSSFQLSTPALENRAGNPGASSKSTNAASHGLSTAAAEDAEAASETNLFSVNSPLHAAKLIAGLEGSEVRVGLRAGEFGKVDIRTSLGRNQFTAEISVERSELGRAMAADLPNLHHRLTEQHLPAANITVQDQSAGGSADFRQGSRQSHNRPSTGVPGSRGHQDSILPVLALEAMEPAGRIDIHM